MIADLCRFVKLAFSRKGVDLGDSVLQGHAFRTNVTDAMLVEGNVLGSEGRSIGYREMRNMRARVDGNDIRA